MADMGTNRREDIKKYGTATVAAALLIVLSVSTRSATSILTPIWLDARKNDTNNTDSCDINYNKTSDPQIDAFAIMCIVNVIFFVFWGVMLFLNMCFSPYSITNEERKYDKREFALVGFSDTVSGLLFVFASSGCRTAPYLQSIAANFGVPVTFIIRYLLLGKRPTCRKTACAVLVLFAEFTALVPDIWPGLESQAARQDQGGASGFAGILWPLCFFFGFIPLALTSVILEKAVKTSSTDHSKSSGLNIAYVLFWCYGFSLVFHVLLFWADIIPGFGMADDILEFAKSFWWNMECYVGREGCHGAVMYVSVACTACLFLNRLVNTYFLRYLEGANYLVIITTIQTPLVFLFFTLFDENPVRWHPHAYLSTYLSLAALCIMIPAIYIYDTGDPECVPQKPRDESTNEILTTVTTSVQTDTGNSGDDMPPLIEFNADYADETTPLIDLYTELPNPVVSTTPTVDFLVGTGWQPPPVYQERDGNASTSVMYRTGVQIPKYGNSSNHHNGASSY